MLSTASRVAVASLLLLACQRVPLDEDMLIEDDDDTGDDTGEPTSGGGSNNADDGSLEPEFGCEPGDLGSCPMGQKCAALLVGNFQNHFECVNDDGEHPVGDECTPSPGTGQDSCAAGSVCLVSTADAAIGRCTALCSSDADCEPGKCTESPYTLTPFCADACDPLQPDCQLGRQCLQADDRFICGIALADTDIGVAGEGCDSSNLRGCAEGYACMAGALVPGCSGGACCTLVCDLNGGDDQCTSPAQCKTLFPEPAPGFDSLGACFVPT